jgi:hypothetical protein
VHITKVVTKQYTILQLIHVSAEQHCLLCNSNSYHYANLKRPIYHWVGAILYWYQISIHFVQQNQMNYQMVRKCALIQQKQNLTKPYVLAKKLANTKWESCRSISSQTTILRRNGDVQDRNLIKNVKVAITHENIPEPLSPVIHTTQPFCPSNFSLSGCPIGQLCHRILVDFPMFDMVGFCLTGDAYQ